jgi:putative flippase GtrA
MSATSDPRREIARFLLVGGIAVTIDAAVYAALLQLGWDPSWAKRASFLAGAAWAFLANKFFTFGSRSWQVAEPVWFVLVYAAGWLANSVVHDLTFHLFSREVLAFLAATAVSTVMNFLGMKFIVFRQARASGAR